MKTNNNYEKKDKSTTVYTETPHQLVGKTAPEQSLKPD